MGSNTTTMRRNAARIANITAVATLLAGIGFALPQAAQAQFGNRGQGRDRYDRYNPNRGEQLNYSRVRIDWNFNGLNAPSRGKIEDTIERALLSNDGARSVRRRQGDDGTMDVTIDLKRLSRDNVRILVQVGLNRDGKDTALITGSASETVLSRDKNIDLQPILRTFRQARRDFGRRVDQYARNY